MVSTDMFERWHDFYLMLGPTAGALIGLLFVVVSLTAGMEGASPDATDAYTTPTAFHLAVIVLMSGLMLSPGITPPLVSAGICLTAGVGFFYAGLVCWWLKGGRVTPPHWSDFWYYGVAACLAYLGLFGAGAMIVLFPALAAWFVSGALMTLLLLAIHNAWDLVTWIAPRSDKSGA